MINDALLYETYEIIGGEKLKLMDDEEKAALKSEIKVSIFDDLYIKGLAMAKRP